MVTKKILLILGMFFAFLATLSYMSCDIKSPVENVKVIFNTKPISTIVVGTFVDASTGELITDKNMQLSINGEYKYDIVDLDGELKNSFSTNNGFVSFAFTESVSPSENFPVSITVVVKAEGYITNFIPLNIINEGSTAFTVNMVRYDKMPEGVTLTTGNINTDSDGITINSSTLTATESKTGITSSVTIPQGVKMKDVNGNVLTGKLTTSMIYYSPKVDESLKSFPGGFEVNVKQNGFTEQSTFITAGVVDITIKDASGREAKTFVTPSYKKNSAFIDTTKPLVQVEIPKDTFNPETNSPIKEGDEIDLWSITPDSAIWNWEERKKIEYDAALDKYFVSFQPSHLSDWNFDWKGTECWKGGTIIFQGIKAPYPLRIVLSGLYGQFRSELRIIDGVLNFFRPPNFPVLIQVYDSNTGKLLGTKTINDLCTFGTLIWELNPTPPTPPRNLIIDAEGYCACNPDLVIRHNALPLWYRNVDLNWGFWLFAGKIENGQVTVPGILSNNRYEYGTWYNGRWYQVTAILSEDRVEILNYSPNINSAYSKDADVLYLKIELPASVCSGLCSSK